MSPASYRTAPPRVAWLYSMATRLRRQIDSGNSGAGRCGGAGGGRRAWGGRGLRLGRGLGLGELVKGGLEAFLGFAVGGPVLFLQGVLAVGEGLLSVADGVADALGDL